MLKKTDDLEFLKKHFEAIKKAMTFYAQKGLLREDLIFESGLANWMDTVLKKGFVLYSNCLWFRAIESLEYLEKLASVKNKTALPSLGKIKLQIQKKLWQEDVGYFTDRLKKDRGVKYLDLAGNVLAILFNIAGPEQAKKIINKIEQNQKAPALKKRSKNKKSVLLYPCVYPFYPLHRIWFLTFPFGKWDYQNGISWSWSQILLIAAQHKVGFKDLSQKNLKIFSDYICQQGVIYENYWLDGKPFNHPLWPSAHPFAWSAGLFLWAVK